MKIVVLSFKINENRWQPLHCRVFFSKIDENRCTAVEHRLKSMRNAALSCYLFIDWNYMFTFSWFATSLLHFANWASFAKFKSLVAVSGDLLACLARNFMPYVLRKFVAMINFGFFSSFWNDRRAKLGKTIPLCCFAFDFIHCISPAQMASYVPRVKPLGSELLPSPSVISAHYFNNSSTLYMAHEYIYCVYVLAQDLCCELLVGGSKYTCIRWLTNVQIIIKKWIFK